MPSFPVLAPLRRSELPVLFAVLCFGVSLPDLGAQQVGDEAVPSLAIGEWRAYAPATYALDVAACGAYAAYATQGGSVVLRYGDSGELRELNKVNALSQSDVVALSCGEGDRLFVLYSDGAIDVVEEERVVTYATAIADADVAGQRGALGIAPLGGGDTVAVHTEFGFVLFDPAAGIFLDDVRWGSAVNDVATFADDLYVATDGGLFVLTDYAARATLRNPAGYAAFDTLVADGSYAGPARRAVNALEVWRGELYVGFADSLLGALTPGAASFRTVLESGDKRVIDLSGSDELLAVAFRRRSDSFGDATFASLDGRDWQRLDDGCAGLPFAVAATPGGGVAFAARVRTGLCRVEAIDAPCDCTTLDTPYEGSSYAIDIAPDGRVAVASGTLNQRGSAAGTANGVYVREVDGSWTNYNRDNTPALARVEPAPEDDSRLSAKDIVEVGFSPSGELWAAAFAEAVVRIDAGDPDAPYEGERFDQVNSSLQVSGGDPGLIRTGGLAFEPNPDGTTSVWVANTEATRPLSLLTPDGQWRSFAPGCGGRNLFTMLRDENTGILWIVNKGNGIVAYDPAGTPTDPSDDRCRDFGASEADGLPSADVRSVVVDRRGSVYVGTANGTAVLRTAFDPFAEGARFDRPAVEIDGVPGFAFDEELVRAIAVDGGNRKWVGTNDGLFLVSANTTEQIARYNVDNSPLPTDRIDALAFDDATGVLWVGTPLGLLSLQTESTGGRELVHGRVEVFPQPVRPDYDGPIAIRGLALDANVKITDAAGRLVYETTAIGGTATWDGRDYTGRRPATGVYFVWAAATGGAATGTVERSEGAVAKIALVR